MRETGLYGQQGAAAEYLRVPAHAVTPVPDGVADRAAVLVEPAVTVLEGVEAIGVRPDDQVLVFGTGTIGLLAVQAAVDRTSAVDVVGVYATGRMLARDLVPGTCTNRRGAGSAVLPRDGGIGDGARVPSALDCLTVGGGWLRLECWTVPWTVSTWPGSFWTASRCAASGTGWTITSMRWNCSAAAPSTEPD